MSMLSANVLTCLKIYILYILSIGAMGSSHDPVSGDNDGTTVMASKCRCHAHLKSM